MQSTLARPKKELEAEIGSYEGWGRGANYDETPWTVIQIGRLKSCVKMALSWFYQPNKVDGFESYSWSFMHPIASLTLPSGESTVRLPDDFGGAEGQATVTLGTASAYLPIDFAGVGQVMNAQSQFPTRAGRPELMAIRPIKGTSHEAGQHQELVVYPIADGDYTLSFQYYLVPNLLEDSFPWALGGAQHSDTVTAACLAAAEMLLDNNRGILWVNFTERLATSISIDRRSKPQALGYNGEMTDWRQSLRPWRQIPTVTFDGVVP